MRCLFTLLLTCLCGLSGLAGAKEVVMAFSQGIPPYTLPESNSGIEVDVAREALAYRGHTLVPNYFPLPRLALAFRYGRVDATMMDLGEDLSQAGGHYADPAVVFDNVLITLKSRNISISQPRDLGDKLVIGFLGAGQRYAEWVAAAKEMGLYFETPDQELQARGLLRGHFDVMLSDRYIYHYFANKLAQERGQAVYPVDEHAFVELDPQNYRPVFRDPKVRDDFNAGLEYLKASGRFQEIYDSYLQAEY